MITLDGNSELSLIKLLYVPFGEFTVKIVLRNTLDVKIERSYAIFRPVVCCQSVSCIIYESIFYFEYLIGVFI